MNYDRIEVLSFFLIKKKLYKFKFLTAVSWSIFEVKQKFICQIRLKKIELLNLVSNNNM